MTTDSIIIPCGHCGTKNRIPKTRLYDRPICARCHTPLAASSISGRPIDVSDGTFESEVLSSSVPVLVDCWAPWCGPCRMVAPVMDQLASEYAGRIKIAKLNVDENPTAASQYQTRSIPTMLFFKGGTLADRLVGAHPKGEIEARIAKLLAR